MITSLLKIKNFNSSKRLEFGRWMFAICFLAAIFLSTYQANAQFNFNSSNLNGENLNNPTSLAFGPDERLYVAQQNGLIKVYTVTRDTINSYSITSTETISLIKNIPNHNDNGVINVGVNNRQITGMIVRGTAANPVIYVTSSDPRIAIGFDSNLDTNSGILSKLTWNGSSWDHVDLVRGLPRCEENHSTNGIEFDEENNIIYLAAGGNTNMGAPSNNFAFTPEYAYSAAILSLDMDSLDNMPVNPASGNYPAYIYDLPTLDDEDRAGVNDANDPFGGNDGKNQAKLTVGSPLQVHSPGWRNPYDIIMSSKGHLISIDNAENVGWGGPALIDSAGHCNNIPNESNSATHSDNLHIIPSSGYYKGHPNSARASIYCTFNSSNPQAAVDAALADGNCDHLIPGVQDGALATYPTSTNGFAEYTASNFGDSLKGDLFVTCFNENIYRVEMNDSGNAVLSNNPIFSGFGSDPLDLICMNDTSPFPGTIWVCTYGANNITIFEPADFTFCSGVNNSYSLDDDNDGFSNADEADNGTDPCNNGSRPSDFDADNLSDLNDPDDDNDGTADELDRYALDADNGTSTFMPFRLDFDNSPDGGIEGWGYTGMMINGTSNWQDLYDLNKVSIGGAAQKFTIDSITPGDAYGTQNDQEYGMQVGINVSAVTTPFTAKCHVQGVFSTLLGPPVDDQSYGMFIGTGDQDNYLKIVCHANGGAGGLRVLLEDSSLIVFDSIYNVAIDTNNIYLYLSVNPINNSVTPRYSYDAGVTIFDLPSVNIPADWISDILACGYISTSGPNPGNEFTGTWNWIDIRVDPLAVPGDWTAVPELGSIEPTARHENAFVQAGDKFVLLGGRGIDSVYVYDINTQMWSKGNPPPVELHHFQAVEHNGLIYCLGAFKGNYPAEFSVNDVYIYDVVADKWIKGPAIPNGRTRGSAGAVVYNDKIYMVGGLTQAHFGTWSKQFDSYDPATNTWTVLPDAPQTRDHFRAVVVNDKMYCIGGMASGHGGPIGLDSVRANVDVFDFIAGTWSTLADSADFPLPRSGPSAGVIGNEIILFGGESKNQLPAHNETDAFDVITQSWRSLDTLIEGRHGTQAITSNSGIYTVAGAGNRGSVPELNSIEVFHMFGTTSPVGTAIDPSEIVTPYTSKNIGAVNINGTINEIVKVYNNNGDQGIVIDSVNLNGCTCYTFNSLPAFPIVLAPGDSLSLNIQFQPIVSDTLYTTLRIFNSTTGSPDTVQLIGVGDSTINVATRINAGGPSYLTTTGNQFIADTYFTNGGTYSNGVLGAIANTVEDSLYFTERSGSGGFQYNVPVLNAKYDVVLHFAELYWGVSGPGGPGKRVFDLTIEGVQVLDDFDILVETSPATAITKVFGFEITDTSVDFDFGVVTDQPKISAIEIIPVPSFSTWYADNDLDGFGSMLDSITSFSTPDGYVANNMDCDDDDANTYIGATEILDGKDNDCDGLIDEGLSSNNIRINCGGPQYITMSNDTFVADAFFVNGAPFANGAIPDVFNTVDDEIYKTERTSPNFGYAILMEKNQTYDVTLHFAEIFWGATGGGTGGANKRVFDVVLEGDTVLKNYDIFASVGAEAADTFKYRILLTDSLLDINIIGIIDQGKISAIEVLLVDTNTCDNPVIDSTNITNVSCFGADDGLVSLVVSGGTAPYTYLWSDGSTNGNNDSLAAGMYTVTVTDNAGCAVTGSATVTTPSIVLVSTSKGNISCNDLNNGTGAAFASGGIAPYSYSWDTSPVEITSSIDSLAGGVYTCTVTDDNGCTGMNSISIFNPSEIIAFTFADNPGPGDINLAVSGGIAPYSYDWSTGATTEDIFGLAPGFYFCQVSDFNGCALIKTATLTSPPNKPARKDEFKAKLDQSSDMDELIVYPNPADNVINVLFNAKESRQFRVMLFDNIGRMVLLEDVQSVIGLNDINLQIDNIPTGVYQMQVFNGSNLQTIRLLIARE